MLKKLKAFTLAEVLITLVIIGIIAAITIPVITANSNEKAYKVALKKNHSLIQQAVERYYIDNGTSLNFNDVENLKDFFHKYFNVKCDNIDCNPVEDFVYKTYDGKNKAIDMQTGRYMFGLTLIDGTYIFYGLGDANSQHIYIDVNGIYKKPNRLGKDTFHYQMFYDDGRIIPSGDKESSFSDKELYCNPSSSRSALNGIGCTAQALLEG